MRLDVSSAALCVKCIFLKYRQHLLSIHHPHPSFTGPRQDVFTSRQQANKRLFSFAKCLTREHLSGPTTPRNGFGNPTSLLTFPQNKNPSASRSPITATVYQFDTKHHTVKSIGRSVALYIHKRHVKLACLCGCFLTLTFCYHCVVEYWWVVPPTSYLAENFCMMPTPNGCELGCCRGCRARWIYPQNDRRRRSKWYLAKVGKKRYCDSEVYKPAPESFIIGKEN